MEKTKVVYEEDIELAVAKAVNIFGPQGRMLEGALDVSFNAEVSTTEHGILWYGDIDSSDYDKLDVLGNLLQVEVRLTASM